MLIPQLRIAQKVPLAIIGGALLVSAAVGVASYLVSASTMEAMSQERLRAISVERAERVTSFLDGLTEDVIQLANTALVQDNAKALATAWSQLENPTELLQKNFIIDNPNPEERWLLDLPEQKNAYSFGHKNAHPGLQVRTVGEVHAKNAYRSPLPTPLETRGIFDRTFPGEVRVKRDGTPLETVGPLLAGLLGPVDPRKMARKLGFLALRSAAFLFRDKELAERVGFEPTVRLPVRRISSAVLSTTQPPLRIGSARAGDAAGGSDGARSSSALGPCLASPRA